MATPPHVLIEGTPAYALIHGFVADKKEDAWGDDDRPDGEKRPQEVKRYIRKLPFFIGREVNAEGTRTSDPEHWLAVPQKQVSREHAVIEWDELAGQFFVTCLGKNGFDVDGKHHDQSARVPLTSKSTMRFGACYVYFLLPSAGEAPKPKAPRAPNVPWRDVIKQTYMLHLAGYGYFTIADIARLAPISYRDPASLPDDPEKLRERLAGALKNEKILSELGLEQLDNASAVPPHVVAALVPHHKSKQKLWYRVKGTESGLPAPAGSAGAGAGAGAGAAGPRPGAAMPLGAGLPPLQFLPLGAFVGGAGPGLQ